MECLSCTFCKHEEKAYRQWNRLWQIHLQSQSTSNSAYHRTSSFNAPENNTSYSYSDGKLDESLFWDKANGHCSHIVDQKFTPWKNPETMYTPGVIGLHSEIMDFYNYMCCTEAEERMRNEVIKKVSGVVTGLWPKSKVDVFGSSRTHLNLPTSDIDIVVFGDWKALPLRTLEKELLNNGICKANDIKVLDKASVPIVKFTDAKTKVKVDICFNMPNGLQSADLIEEFLHHHPSLRYIVMVVKHYLVQRDLNEVFNGGLSSYALILMVVSFFQNHERKDANDSSANLGVLLIEFLELYGRRFNYINTAVSVRDGGGYISKNQLQLDGGALPSGLCIEDPLKPSNDIGRSSYQVLTIRESFYRAYLLLLSHSLPQYSPLHEDKYGSVLGIVVRVEPEVQEYRQWIEQHYSVPAVPHVNITTVSVTDSSSSLYEKSRKHKRPEGDSDQSDSSSVASSCYQGSQDDASSDVDTESSHELKHTRAVHNRFTPAEPRHMTPKDSQARYTSTSEDDNHSSESECMPSSGISTHIANKNRNCRTYGNSSQLNKTEAREPADDRPVVGIGRGGPHPGKRRKHFIGPHNKS